VNTISPTTWIHLNSSRFCCLKSVILPFAKRPPKVATISRVGLWRRWREGLWVNYAQNRCIAIYCNFNMKAKGCHSHSGLSLFFSCFFPNHPLLNIIRPY
jgi:hypothetical protein